MNIHLQLLLPAKPLIIFGDLLNINRGRRDEVWLGLAAANQVNKLGRNELCIDGTASEAQVLDEESRERERDVGGEVASKRCASRAGLDRENAQLSDATALVREGDHVAQNDGLIILQRRVNRLHTHAVQQAHHAIRLTFEYLGYRVASGKIDRDRTDGRCTREAVCDMVHDVHARCAAQDSRIGGEEANGASAENRHCITRLEVGPVEPCPSCSKDIRDGEIVLLDSYASRIVGDWDG